MTLTKMHSDQMSICSFCLLINFVMVIFLRGCNFLGPLDCIDSKSPSGYETMSEISHTNHVQDIETMTDF